MAIIPPPEPSTHYASSLQRFEQMLYCRRCASFTSNGIGLGLEEAVAECFGLDYLFEAYFRYSQDNFGEIIEANAARAWSTFAESKDFSDPEATKAALDRAIAGLPANGFGTGEQMISLNAGSRGAISVFVYEFGNPGLAKLGGVLLAKKHLPGFMLLGAAMTDSLYRLEVAGVFYVPNTATNAGMKKWYQSRADVIYQAAGLI